MDMEVNTLDITFIRFAFSAFLSFRQRNSLLPKKIIENVGGDSCTKRRQPDKSRRTQPGQS